MRFSAGVRARRARARGSVKYRSSTVEEEDDDEDMGFSMDVERPPGPVLQQQVISSSQVRSSACGPGRFCLIH